MARRIKDESMLKRITVLVVIALFFWVLLFLRLVQVQIFQRAKYVAIANKQYIYEAELKSERGIIYDRNLEPLAVNRKITSVGIDVTKVANADSTAAIFSDIFQKSKQVYLDKFNSGSPFFWLGRRVDERVAAKLETLDIPGLRLIKEAKRFYPRGSLASHILGFTNIDLKGLSGIELSQNNILKGNNGLASYYKDALGNIIVDLHHPVKKPRKGKNIILTIDNTFQWIAEEELKTTVENYDADAGIVIITNPNTGEILASAVIPSYDPNRAGEFSPDTWRNRVITDSYEPGSTFKSMIIAAVLEEGIKSPNDIVFCENGEYKIYDRVVKDLTPYGWLSIQNVLKKSSNIGMTKIAQELDKQLVYRYIRDFGFGLETGIELPGEASGELKKPVQWSKYTAMAMAIGYEISVTPLQMAMAYGAIANGGLLLKPKIYIAVVDKMDKKIGSVEPEVIRRVISESTAKTLTNMLEEVVYDGTGKRAYIKGLRIAGKTGTAIKYDPQLNRYSENKYVSSFIGFFPAEAPQLLMYVMIDNPKKGHLGGKVAAPTFRRILKKILRYIELEPNSTSELADSESGYENGKGNVPIPDLTDMRFEAAQEIAAKLGFELIAENKGDLIASQRSNFTKRDDGTLQLFVKLKTFTDSNKIYTTVPSVIGNSLREALTKMAQHGLRLVVEGSGRVVSQIPAPGSNIRVGARCVVVCEPAIDMAEFSSW